MRIVKGKTVSDIDEIRRYNGDFLIGSCSNKEIFPFQQIYMQKDIYVERLYMRFADMNKTNLIIGKMGSGKSNLMKYIVAAVLKYKKNRVIIHDIKAEYVSHFFDEQRDVIINHLDERGVVWDILSDCKRDKMLARSILQNAVASYNDKKDQFWIVSATSMLENLVDEVKIYTNPLGTANSIKDWFIRKKDQIKGATEQSALATAVPVIQLLFDLYYIAGKSDKYLYSLDEILQKRVVYLVFIPEFSKSMSIINQALLAGIFNRYLSKDDVKTQDEYTIFVLDEYLNFRLDEDLEKLVLTLARSKGMCLFLGMQFLPVNNKDRQNLLLNSRQNTFVFRIDSVDTAKILEESSGKLEYTIETVNASGGSINMQDIFSATGNEGVGEMKIDTFTIPKELLLSLPDYICYTELGTEHGKIRTFTKPVWFDIEPKTKGFIRDENTRNLLSI